MLESSGATPIGPGRVKLVQVLDGDGPPPVPEGQAWGEVGVCEICLHVRDVQAVHDALVAAGCASLMGPMSADVPPAGVTLDIAYVADPWGTKLEMIEWTGLWRSLPGPPARKASTTSRSASPTWHARAPSTSGSGSRELLFESVEFFDPMAPWYEAAVVRPGGPARAAHDDADARAGRGDRAVVLDPPGHDCRGTWGHLGPMDFGIRVGNIDAAAAQPRGMGRAAARRAAVSVDVGSGEWRYVYFVEPDGNYVRSSRRAIDRARPAPRPSWRETTMPSRTHVTHARVFGTPSTTTRQSKHTPMPQ